ncbi:MAG TPA: HNH endonuclease [Actinomycetota bacterium]|nr:HNH endonuclease [Actinomycetota bacterium]
MSDQALDEELRAAALAYVNDLVQRTGNRIPAESLTRFTFRGRQRSLIIPRGILKVHELDAALTIRTAYAARPQDRPYADDIGPDGYPRYKWRGFDADNYDNVALRVAMAERTPLIWFIGIAPGVYEALLPVYIVGEEPDQHQFVVALDEEMRAQWHGDVFHPIDLARRREYALAVVRRRIHQPLFREQVIAAYSAQCALCRLRRAELLEAAHIKSDAEGGLPIVPNGIAMCALHHQAFDRYLLGVRPDYVIELRSDVLREQDGPTLRHALQGLHGQRLTVLPRRRELWPDPLLLEERYERFRQAS